MAFAVSAADEDKIIAAVFPASVQKLLPNAQTTIGQFRTQIEANQLTIYLNQSDCSKAGSYNPAAYQSPSPLLAGVQGGFGAAASSFINSALQAIPVIGQTLSQIWNKINPFAAHAKAVANEQGILCGSVPQVNAALQQVDADVLAGNVDLPTADAELDQIASQFRTVTASIIKDDSSHCNAACVVNRMVQAEVLLRKEKYKEPAIFYVKRYWWVGAVALLIFVLFGRD